MSQTRTDRVRIRTASVLGLLIGAVAYGLTLFDYGTDLGRTANTLRFGSNFFDLQGRAILHGHLAVPKGSLGIEGFVHHGHTYMYFGPFPALIRLPVLLLTHDFDGRLSLVSMGVAWIVFAVMTVRLCWLVRSCLFSDRAVSRLDATCATIFLAAATGGTVLTFDASLPWVYHEVYVWSAALVISTFYWMVRVGLDPTPYAVRWLGGLAACTMLTRMPAGLGVCLGILALGLWMRFGRSQADRRRIAIWVLVAALAPLAIGIAINLLKFGNPIFFPLQDQVWTQVNAHRREALRVNGGSITGTQFLWTSLVNYFSPVGIRFVDYFPWITLPADNARAYGGAYLDQSYRTGSVTAFSTLLLFLALIALPAILRRTRAPRVQLLRVPALAAIVMPAGVMSYGYIAYRYTSEFVPALVFGGAIGVWLVARRLAPPHPAARWLRVPVLALMAGFAVFAIVANMAVGFAAAAQTSRGTALQRYVALQTDLSGGDRSFRELVTHSDALPANTRNTDGLHIMGDCEALYLNTGDRYERWLLVEGRSHVVTVDFAQTFKPTRILLFTVQGIYDRTVWLQTYEDHLAQLVLDNEKGTFPGPLFSPAPGEPLQVGVGQDGALGYAEVTSTPGGFVGYLPLSEWDRSWINENGSITDAIRQPTTTDGVSLRPGKGLPMPLCERVATAAGLHLGG